MGNCENGLDTFLLLIDQHLPELTHVLPGPSVALAADPKYKKYTQQVEKCLATFDSVHEWADFIAFLTKLLKVHCRLACSDVFHTDVVGCMFFRPFKVICSIKKYRASS